MLISVVASGESASGWIPRGTCIGSNDCLKWGKDVDILILVNKPQKFGDRIHTIKKSKAKVLTNSVAQWKPYFPNCEKLTRLINFNKLILKNFIYSSKTSPIICLSLAIKMGATEIIMWGVDFTDHHTYREGTRAGQLEIDVYKRFFKECKRIGVKVYLGLPGTAFDKVLPLYPHPYGMMHYDEWDKDGTHHSWNIPGDFEPDLPTCDRIEKWKISHPEFANFSDIDYANELMKKYIKE